VKSKFNKKGRISATFAVFAVFIMISVSFTVMSINSDCVSAAPEGTVIYDANGGSFESGSLLAEHPSLGDEVKVNFDITPTREDFVFVGWALTSGGEAVYRVTDPYEDTIFTPTGRFFIMNGNVTLYAVWKAVDLTVTFVNNTTYNNKIYLITYNPISGTHDLTVGGTLVGSGNVLSFKGTVVSTRIEVESTAPLGSDNQLYLLMDGLTVTREYTSGSPTASNVVDIYEGANVILQTRGTNSFTHSSTVSDILFTRAMINVPNGSTLIFQGQANSTLNLTQRSTGDNSQIRGAGIGGDEGERAGDIRIESGRLNISQDDGTNATSFGLYSLAAGIGSGGLRFAGSNATSAPAGGSVTVYGGTISITQKGVELAGAGIGGGGISRNNGSGAAYAGDGGDISIFGGKVTIRQTVHGAHNIDSAGIGGGGVLDNLGASSRGGDSGAINISGGKIDVRQETSISTYSKMVGAGIGGGGSGTGSGGHARSNDGRHYINISGGDIFIFRDAKYDMLGAGIGGGGTGLSESFSLANSTQPSGGDAEVKISGGAIIVDMRSKFVMNGAGIGAGNSKNISLTNNTYVEITGGSTNVYMYSEGSTTDPSSSFARGSGIGGGSWGPRTSYASNILNLRNSVADVLITGGNVTVDRPHRGYPSTDIGGSNEYGGGPSGPSEYKVKGKVALNGGSVYILNDNGHEEWIADAKASFEPDALNVNITEVEPSGSPWAVVNSVYIATTVGTVEKTFRDCHIPSLHVKSWDSDGTPNAYYPFLRLYLPFDDGSVDTSTKISIEMTHDGEVELYDYDGTETYDYIDPNDGKSYMTFGGVTEIVSDDIFYRVEYVLAQREYGPDGRVRYVEYIGFENNVVHVVRGTNFNQTFISLDYPDHLVPSGMSYVEKINSSGHRLQILDQCTVTFEPRTPGDVGGERHLKVMVPDVNGKIVLTPGHALKFEGYAFVLTINGTGSVTIAGSGYYDGVYTTTSTIYVGPSFTATATSGNFVSWSGYTGSVSDKTLTVTLTGDGAATANFSGGTGIYKFDLTVNGTGSVTVAGSGDYDGVYTTTSTIYVGPSFTATATSGNFVSWSGYTGSVSDKTLTVTLTGDGAATANFGIVTEHTIIATAGPGGKIDPAGTVLVPDGDNIRFNFIPNYAYVVYRIVVDGVETSGYSLSKYYIFNDVRDSHTIEVYFAERTHTITSSSDSYSTISPEGITSVRYGDSMTYTFKAEEGYAIVDVIIDNISRPEYVSVGKYTFSNVKMSHTIRVVTEEMVIFDVNIVGNGRVEYSINGSAFYDYIETVYFMKGSNIYLRGHADDGNQFSYWSGAISSSKSEVEMENVTQSITVTAHFEENDTSLLNIIMLLFAIIIIILLIFLIAAMRNGYKVIEVESGSATIHGKNRARKNRPYVFTVTGDSDTVSYSVGNGASKAILPDLDGQYIIPEEDVTDILTISV